jgi:TRAP-type mannitol/chloroaromatic compound transport system permease small subunit
MPKAIRIYVQYVEAANKAIGVFSMFLVFGMMGVLLYESLFRTILNEPHIWVVETAQFIMAAYYLLAGGYSMMLDSHVRMDLLYSKWSPKGQALADCLTSVLLGFYMVVLIIGGFAGVKYAVIYNQVNYTPWSPRLAPIKIIMTFGLVMMLLQVIAQFFRDLAKARGKTIP